MNERQLVQEFKQKLITEYGYDEKNIRIDEKILIGEKNWRPDIIILNNNKPYIVIEVKNRFINKDFDEKFIKQTFDYALELECEFFAVTTLSITKAFKIENKKPISIPNIPNKDNEFESQKTISDYNNLVGLFAEMREILWSGGKRDDFTIISQFNKLLLIKYYVECLSIESTRNKLEEFWEYKEYVYENKINDLLSLANEKYKVFYDEEKINLNQNELRNLIELLLHIDLKNTNNIEKIYIESFIKPLKNENIVSNEFVELFSQLNLNSDFLIINSGFGQLSLNFNMVYNIESNKIKVETSKILQIIKRLSHEYILGEVLDYDLTNGNKFDFIWAIPPINFKVKKYFDYQIEQEKVNKEYACLLIEKSLSFLKDNGILFIVLPNGILSNISYAISRVFIEKHFNILSVISLPSETFLNTNILTSLVILQKKQNINTQQEEPIFFSTLSKLDNNDQIVEKLNDICIKKYDLIKKQLVDYLNLSDRWDSHYYEEEFLELERKIRNIEYYPLKNYVQIIRGSSLGNNNLGTVPLIVVSSIENGQIVEEKLSKVTEVDSEKNPRGIVVENDIIITVVGKRPKCALVTEEFKGANTNSGIVILRAKNSDIDINELFNYLNSELGQALLYRGITYTSTVPILTQTEIEKIPMITSDYKDFLNDFPKLKEMFSTKINNENITGRMSKEKCQQKIEEAVGEYKKQIEILSNEKLDDFRNKFTLLHEDENILSLFGLAGDVFGIDVVRTFITLEDLKSFETNRQNFQRDIKASHNEELITFLKEGKYKFFPEIVLGIKNVDDLKEKEYLIHELIEANSGITKLIFKNRKVFENIEVLDGRHRIESIKKYLEDNSVNGKDTVSIVFILLNESQTIDLLDKAIFYNLNAKARVLEPIDYLNLLVNDKEDKLRELKITNIDVFKFFKDNVEKIYDDKNDNLIFAKCISLTDNLVDCLEEQIDDEKQQRVLNLLEYINVRILKQFDISFKTKLYMLTIYIFSKKEKMNDESLKIFVEKELKGFIEWLNLSSLMNGLSDIDNLKDFYLTYEKVYIPKSRKIYLSMPYHKETEWTYFVIKDVINEISNNLQIKINLIRTDQQTHGVHTGISETVYNEIESCDLMIADLTGDNVNVFNEVGFKMGIDRAQKLSETQIIFLVNSKCYYKEKLENSSFKDDEYEVTGKILRNKSKDVPFNLRGIKHIEFYTSHYLKAELYKELEQYFNYYKISKV